MQAVTRIFIYLIPIVFLVIALSFYYLPDRGFDSLKGAVNGVKDYVPGFGEVEDEFSSEGEFVPREQRTKITDLADTIELMLASSKTNCFANYGGLPDLGEYATSITFSAQESGTVMQVRGGTDGRKIEIGMGREFDAMVPCVIAGNEQLVKNFFSKFITGNNVGGNYYNPASEVRIFYDEGGGTGISCNKGNRINTGTSGAPNTNCNNFEDSGMLFTPDNKHICFFPTNYVINSDEHGIENAYIGGESNSLMAKFRAGIITRCE